MLEQQATLELEPHTDDVDGDVEDRVDEGPALCTCPDWCPLDHAN